MSKPIIAILATGEMGAGVGAALTRAGFTVTTITQGRSAESVQRAAEANMQPRADLPALLADCDIFMSIVPPALALETGAQVANEAKTQGLNFTFVECNAISPDHTIEIAKLFSDSQINFIDAGIIGGPPNQQGYKPVLYISGATSEQLNQTDGSAYKINNLGGEIGRASGMKMTYASITKGVNALLAGAFLTAENLGLLDELMAELKTSQTEMYTRATNNIQRLPADAGRWAPEMREISQTFESAGAPKSFHQGAEQMMQILHNSPYGVETRRTRDTNRSAAETIKNLLPK